MMYAAMLASLLGSLMMFFLLLVAARRCCRPCFSRTALFCQSAPQLFWIRPGLFPVLP
jgi:hypothetical protein